MFYLVAALVGLLSYVVAARFERKTRAAIALAVFLIPSVLMTAWVLKVGDQAEPDTVNVEFGD
jgi:uncharacterized membrane protein